MGLLDTINGPEDLKRLPFRKLPELASELRRIMIGTVSKTGGHLASNLGVVELTIALHRVFDSPRDKIIFDVGHQCYAHKLLTGRRDRFPTLRQYQGLSGFPKRAESSHDAFLAGHSSTSISAAVGMARAKKLLGEPGKAIAVIGDGAFSGVAFEALNNVDGSLENLVVVLNDNEMSISKNMTTIARHLAKIRNSSGYYSFKDGVERTVSRIPVVGDPLHRGISAVKTAAKDLLYHSNLFEDMGLTYLGPVDGHNIQELCACLTRAKSLREPVIVHVHTVKGKGYLPAEVNPGAFHGVSQFDPRKARDNALSEDTFSEQAGLCLARFGEQDGKLVAVTAAMKYATGLHHFSAKFRGSGRFFDVGIAESHAVIFSAALAVGGLRPVFCVYSSFLQRAYDQLLHDCSLEPVHLVLGVDRAGMVGEDGETHQGLFDVPMLASLPGAAVYSPFSYSGLERCFRRALYEDSGLAAVRYPRGRQTFHAPDCFRFREDFFDSEADSPRIVISYGRIAEIVRKALELSGAEYREIILEKILPIPEEALRIASGGERIVFVEEGSASGGVGEQFGGKLLRGGFTGEFVLKAVENPVVPQGSVDVQFRLAGLDPESLAEVLG